MLTTFNTWIDEQDKKLKDSAFNVSSKYWTGTQIIAELHNSGLDERNTNTCEVF